MNMALRMAAPLDGGVKVPCLFNSRKLAMGEKLVFHAPKGRANNQRDDSEVVAKSPASAGLTNPPRKT